jgi:short-subunit dehydrogenase
MHIMLPKAKVLFFTNSFSPIFVGNSLLMNSFENKVVAITGGTTGIGRALIDEFIRKGAKVATCGRSQDKLYDLQKEYSGITIYAVVADVSKESDCKSFIDSTVKAFGGIDILINNAGISMRAMVEDTEIDTLKRVMDINFWGTVYCTKYALPSIISRKGTIVGVSSIAGYRGLPGRSGYSASKHAVNGWLEALRTEMLDKGVNVMWVCPGFTSSNIRNVALNSEGQPQGESPMDEGKMMSAEECAQRILKAIDKKKRSVVMTFQGKETVFMNRFFPKWADRLVKNYFIKNGVLVK